MAMEISDRYGFDYINKAQTGQTAIAAERAGEAAKSKEKDKPDVIYQNICQNKEIDRERK